VGKVVTGDDGVWALLRLARRSLHHVQGSIDQSDLRRGFATDNGQEIVEVYDLPIVAAFRDDLAKMEVFLANFASHISPETRCGLV
jgi:hypothetical protein